MYVYMQLKCKQQVHFCAQHLHNSVTSLFLSLSLTHPHMYTHTSGMLKNITLHGVKTLRDMLNDSVLDIFFYTSLKYGPEVRVYGPVVRDLYGPEVRDLYGPEVRDLYGPEVRDLYGPEVRDLYGIEVRDHTTPRDDSTCFLPVCMLKIKFTQSIFICNKNTTVRLSVFKALY